MSAESAAPAEEVIPVLRAGDAAAAVRWYEGDARPDTLVYLRVADLDAVAAEFGLVPQEEPWGRELALTDPDGNRLRVGPARA
ncbi:hypothetical protein [Streptomyces parvulus]|uniref:hypothetical protein n=1 Tax=Streptomyces parvulus TaxID=146923 RepID=UPI001CF9CCE6|nr:hypothetical protein [Streptomyces parvulus]